MLFDMLIKDGYVFDPAAGYDGRMDVGIQRNRITSVEPQIPAASARRLIDAHGQYVLPGLIDLHTHIYPGGTFWGIHPDPVASQTGVTTWVDAGSAGAFNLAGLRQLVVKPSAVRIYAFLNISAIGLTAPRGESLNLENCDVDTCTRLIDLHHDLIVGVKVRMDQSTVGANGLEPLRRARLAADRCARPLMVHIAAAPPAIEQVLDLLRPGDILTHCLTGQTMRLVDDSGKLLHAAQRAREAGVIMDVGHGAGSFSFATAEALAQTNQWPDVISTDIHQLCVRGPMFDLPTCLSKFLALGMPFSQVIRAATQRPAEILGLGDEIGTLHPGAFADVALFRLHQGHFPFYDVDMQMREGKTLLRNTLTIVNGRPLAWQPEEEPAPWIRLTEAQETLIARGHTPTSLALANPQVIYP